MTREQIEAALDSGRLEVRLTSGKWQSVRRNGATKLRKTRPGEFRIPAKTGFRTTFQITECTTSTIELRERPSNADQH